MSFIIINCLKGYVTTINILLDNFILAITCFVEFTLHHLNCDGGKDCSLSLSQESLMNGNHH